MHTSGYWFSFSEEESGKRSANDMQMALLGLANVLIHLAPLHLMCDPLDIRVVPQVKSTHTKRPTIYFYDRYPGGIGLSQRLYEKHDELLEEAQRLITGCGCLSGCPACVGPIEEVGLLGKDLALTLLQGTRKAYERIEGKARPAARKYECPYGLGGIIIDGSGGSVSNVSGFREYRSSSSP